MILIKFATEIKGQSNVDGHAGWINVESLSWGVGRAIAGQAAGSAKREVSSPSVSEASFSRLTDGASPELFFQACGGVSLGKCEIHFLQVVENKPQVYLKIELEDAMIASYSLSSGGDKPSESFSVNFTKVSFQYDTFDGKSIKTGTAKKWDLAANKSA